MIGYITLYSLITPETMSGMVPGSFAAPISDIWLYDSYGSHVMFASAPKRNTGSGMFITFVDSVPRCSQNKGLAVGAGSALEQGG